jgi:putative NIF3 family GTP cyclohydrolase 1 type 2
VPKSPITYYQSPIQTVALCGGSGAEFIGEAIAQGADVYITADCKYHEFQDAAGRIGLIDIDHWYSERHARDIFKDILAPLGIPCYISKTDKTPIQLWQKQKN